MIKFSIGGRTVDPRNVGDALMQAALQQIKAQITSKIGSIRDPETGEFPTIIVRGDSLDKLSLHVEGSPQLVALVKERLGITSSEQEQPMSITTNPPKVFLSYTSDDLALAERIARALHGNGIETWWDRWCIYPGDSLRRKIDEGLAGCTHFVVLLTPRSISKPWVNQEMDAALVAKLRDQCKFIPLRSELPAAGLPRLLSGMHSPEISGDDDITQLVNDIHGISRKPPLGAVPKAAASAVANTGYSPAATMIAKLFVESTRYGMFADPQFEMEEIASATGLTVDDVKDGLYELSGFFRQSSASRSIGHVLVESTLFANFDQHWKPWNPADDALRLAADIVNDAKFPHDPKEIAALYGWEPRRLNPAIAYLAERGLIVDYRVLASNPYITSRVVGNENMRRFVKSRSS